MIGKGSRDGVKKKPMKPAPVIDIKALVKKKEAHAEQLKKLTEVRIIARRMGLDTRNATKTELIRAIQRAEGNRACYMTDEFLKCEQTNCLWREDCSSW